MDKTRQDAWTKDEDIMLAETVLQYIREGKTQLEAFKKVGKQLSRTPAACGFRWNATIRQQHKSAIEHAKEEKKQGSKNKVWHYLDSIETEKKDKLDTAILLLKEMKYNTLNKTEETVKDQELTVSYLKKENEWLKGQLVRYDEAWKEMGALWNWVKATEQEKNQSS